MTDLTPVLSAQWGDERSWLLDTYERDGGYRGFKKALGMKPEEVTKFGGGSWLLAGTLDSMGTEDGSHGE